MLGYGYENYKNYNRDGIIILVIMISILIIIASKAKQIAVERSTKTEQALSSEREQIQRE